MSAFKKLCQIIKRSKIVAKDHEWFCSTITHIENALCTELFLKSYKCNLRTIILKGNNLTFQLIDKENNITSYIFWFFSK